MWRRKFYITNKYDESDAIVNNSKYYTRRDCVTHFLLNDANTQFECAYNFHLKAAVPSVESLCCTYSTFSVECILSKSPSNLNPKTAYMRINFYRPIHLSLSPKKRNKKTKRREKKTEQRFLLMVDFRFILFYCYFHA